MERPRDSLIYLRAYVRLAALVGLGIAALLWLSAIYSGTWHVLVALHYNDFGKFYYAALQARHGDSLYGPSPATLIPLSATLSREFWDLNPPHFHLLIWPLSFLSLPNAFLVWTAVNAGLVGASIRVVWSELSLRVSFRTFIVATVLTLAAAPTLTWFVTGQLTGILAAIGTWIWRDMRRERWDRAGIAIGVACSLKLFFGPLFLYLALRRRWRAVAAATVALWLCFVAGALVYGVKAHREWIGALHGVQWIWAPMNASVAAPFSRIRVPLPALASGATPSPVWTGVAVAAALAVLLAGLGSSIRARTPDGAISILYLTCLLSSPLGWVYYHWILIGPGLAAFRHTDRRLLALPCAGFLVPFFLLIFERPALAVTIGSMYSWSTLGLWAIAVSHACERDLAPAPSRTVHSE